MTPDWEDQMISEAQEYASMELVFYFFIFIFGASITAVDVNC